MKKLYHSEIQAFEGQMTIDDDDIKLVIESGFLNFAHYHMQSKLNLTDLRAATLHYLASAFETMYDPCAMFMTRYYLMSNPDVAASGINPLVHYLRYGSLEGRSPHPAYDPSYVKQITQTSGSAHHFLRIDEFINDPRYWNVDPHPLFDVDYYDEQRDVTSQRKCHGLGHYFDLEQEQKPSPHPLFDPEWYCNTYGDIPAGIEYIHFLIWGGHEMRDPSPYFSSEWYARKHTDVDYTKISSLMHYCTVGRSEQRQPHLLFDPTVFKKNLDEIGAYDAVDYSDYIAGKFAYIPASDSFSPHWYSSTQAKSPEVGQAALKHFLQVGLQNGALCRPYSKFVQIARDAIEDAQFCEMLVSGHKVHALHEEIDHRSILQKMDDLGFSDIDGASLRFQLQKGMHIHRCDFSNEILLAVKSIAKASAPFSRLAISFSPLNEQQLIELLTTVECNSEDAGTDKSDDLLIINTSGGDLCLPPYTPSNVILYGIENAQICRTPHYFSEMIKSLLMSLDFSVVYIIIDEQGLNFVDRFMSQLNTLPAVRLVLITEKSDVTVVANFKAAKDTRNWTLPILKSALFKKEQDVAKFLA